MEDLKKRKLEEASNGEHASKEEIRLLIEPLAKPQLVDLLAKLGSQYPSIAEEIKSIASADPVHRKLFVRGLAWNTTSETLRAAFQEHGEIEEGAVIYDKATGKSRGYGFITYKNMESAQNALRAPSKLIDSKRFGREVQLHELHLATHIRRSTRDFVDDRSRRTQEEFETSMSQIRSQSSSCSPSQIPGDPSAPLRVWADVVGGKKKGRLYGVDDLASNFKKGARRLHIGESTSSSAATSRSATDEQEIAQLKRAVAEQQRFAVEQQRIAAEQQDEARRTSAILAQVLERQEQMYQLLTRQQPQPQPQPQPHPHPHHPPPLPPPPGTDHVDDADGLEHIDHDQDY